jgi:glycosyltransferase involved in cell wall biosynthesis
MALKIALVNSFYPPWRGGAETYTYNLAKALHERGHEIIVVCADEPLPPGEYKSDGIRVVRLSLAGRLYGTPLIPTLFTTLCELDVDLYHANFPSPYLAFNVAIASRLKRKKAVLTWHNDLPSVSPLAHILIEIHNRLILPIYIRWFEIVIATSQRYLEISAILRKLGTRLRVVANGVDCQRFIPVRVRMKKDELVGLRPKREFVLLFVGALTEWHRYKGLDVLLQALRIVADREPCVSLIVVGGGGLKEEYQELANNLGLEKHVTFVGDVDDSLLPQYYAHADATVVPSKDMSEGFGLTILEANASGKPVVASQVGGIPSVVRNGYNGLLIPPNSPVELANAILYLKKHRRRAIRMGKNGRLFAERYDWAIVALETEKIYRAALTGDTSFIAFHGLR